MRIQIALTRAFYKCWPCLSQLIYDLLLSSHGMFEKTHILASDDFMNKMLSRLVVKFTTNQDRCISHRGRSIAFLECFIFKSLSFLVWGTK